MTSSEHALQQHSERVTNANHSTAPLAKAAEAISATTTHALNTPQVAISPFTEATSPSSTAVENAYAPTLLASTPMPAPETTPPVGAPTLAPTAAPALAPSVNSVVAPPPAPQGPLLAYGSDLKPPSTPPQAVPAPTSGMPGSAPVGSVGQSGAAGQPTVVRQHPTADRAQLFAPGLTEKAVAATAIGATLGSGAARDAAADRLRRLLESVARQQPKLRWGIGDFADDDTLIVCDLAGGWIPPHIDIPAGGHLLAPAIRRTDLATLLSGATLTAVYEPGGYLPRTGELVAMSLRARDTAAVDELGWELAQATKWRDGLPRLAHTLARAVSAKTGCLDSEVELLREYLTGVAGKVLGVYPNSVDPAEVGNWQLLATIDALVNGEKTSANYHFAWFRAQNPTWEAHR